MQKLNGKLCEKENWNWERKSQSLVPPRDHRNLPTYIFCSPETLFTHSPKAKFPNPNPSRSNPTKKEKRIQT